MEIQDKLSSCSQNRINLDSGGDRKIIKRKNRLIDRMAIRERLHSLEGQGKHLWERKFDVNPHFYALVNFPLWIYDAVDWTLSHKLEKQEFIDSINRPLLLINSLFMKHVTCRFSMNLNTHSPFKTKNYKFRSFVLR